MAARKSELVITCNAKAVQAVFDQLDRQLKGIKQRMQQLNNQGAATGWTKDMKNEFRDLSKQANALNSVIIRDKDEMVKFGNVIKDLSGAKLKDLKKALQEGKRALNNMAERDPNRKKLVDDLKRIQQQIEKNTGAVKQQGSALATTAKNLTTYMIGFAGFNKVKELVEGVFRSNLKLSDSLANIRKVSGLSGEAINELYRNITKIDTRNTIEMLNQLAYTGAKLGIGQNYGVSGLTGFVKAAEQVQMALGEDMGEKALPELSKMVEVMRLIPKYGVEQSMQKAASAIFQLGATSTATGTNIIEFSKRLMGLANVSRVSTQDLLALGSASDAMGLMPEVSATAFNKLFTAIQKNHNLIEDTLGMTKGTIKDFYDKGQTMDAIVEIFKKMNQTGNMNLLGGVFKDLGSDGARLVNVMATMADRFDILEKHLKTSREAFKDGEAVIGEYMIQNETAAALMERASNLWAKAFTNPEGVDMVKEMAKAWYDLSKQMTQSDAMMWSLHKSISAIASVIGTLISLFPILLRFAMAFGVAFSFKAAWLGIVGIRTAFLAMIKDIRMATGAVGLFNAAFNSNIFFAVAAAIGTVITLLIDFSKAASEAAEREIERQDELRKAFQGSKEAVEKSIDPLKNLKSALDSSNLSEEQKLGMLKEFKSQYQDYLDYLGIEINSALDLAKAYTKVAEAMKLKKAYEERESYRTQENGNNRMDRIAAQAQVEAALRSMGITGIDKAWLQKNQRMDTATLYATLLSKKYGNVTVKDNGTAAYRVSADRKRVDTSTDIGNTELWNALSKYQIAYRAERHTNKLIDEMFNEEFDGLDKFDIDKFNAAVDAARWKRSGSLEKEAVGKDAIAAAKKAASDAKQHMRKDMEDAQKNATGIIAKIEEWYRLQEAAINDARAAGEVTAEQADKMVTALNISKNRALEHGRRAVTSGDAKVWDEFKQKYMPQAMADAGELSSLLLKEIQDVSVEALHNKLKNFNGSEKVFGLSIGAFFAQMDQKAAGNKREAARLRAKLFNDTEKMLKQYEVVEKMNDKLRADAEQVGLITETYEQWAERQRTHAPAPATDAYTKMGAKFIGQGTSPYSVNIENGSESLQWFQKFVTVPGDSSSGATGELEAWAQAFPKIKEWIDAIKAQQQLQPGETLGDQQLLSLQEAMPAIRALFYQLDSYAAGITKTIQQQVQTMTARTPIGLQEMKAQHDQQIALTTQLYDAEIKKAGDNKAAITQLEEEKNQELIRLNYDWQQQMYQLQQQMRTTWQDEYDNEVALYKNMLDKKLISEQQFQRKRGELQAKLGLKYGQYFNGLMSSLVDSLQEYEIAASNKKYDILISQAEAAGQDTTAIEEEKEADQLEIQKKYADMRFAVKASEIIANTAVAIMNAWATLPTYAAAAATALIAATGTLQLATANAERERIKGLSSGSKKITSSSSSAATTKLVSGMLTYDEGNVQHYVGTDGRVYAARENMAPGTGLVTHPIATTVQGQPSLVAENGPEIVVGRRATRAIMMNEPELIARLATYDRHARRLYDTGTPIPATVPEDSPEGSTPSIQPTLEALQQTITLLQHELAKGIHAKVAKFGPDGIYEGYNSARQFMERYDR